MLKKIHYIVVLICNSVEVKFSKMRSTGFLKGGLYESELVRFERHSFISLAGTILPSLPVYRVTMFSKTFRTLMTFFTDDFGVQKFMNIILTFYI